MRKVLAYTFVVLAVAAGLVGCSAGKQDSQAVSLHVALVSASVSDGSVEGLATHLQSGVPEYNDDEKSFRVTGISAGDPAADPMSVMAGSTRIAGLMASREIELWISDAENAKRYADNGANFIALDELFTAEQIDSFGGTPVAIPLTDGEGNATGEFSRIVGVDLSEDSAIAELTGIRDPHVFVLAGTTNLEAAKAAFRLLADRTTGT